MKYSNIVRIAAFINLCIAGTSALCVLGLGGENDLSIPQLIIGLCASIASTYLFGWLGVKLREMVYIVQIGEDNIEQEEEYENDINPNHTTPEQKRENFMNICKQIGIDPLAPINDAQK